MQNTNQPWLTGTTNHRIAIKLLTDISQKMVSPGQLITLDISSNEKGVYAYFIYRIPAVTHITRHGPEGIQVSEAIYESVTEADILSILSS